jgi:hypothetical protein
MSERDAVAVLTARIHVQLREHLFRTYPLTPVEVILTALTYEIGRIAGEVMPPELDVDELVDTIAANMKSQIRAYRAGRLKG